jgi:hypothetical protein
MIPLCKAKRIDNGEWVEGYVIYDQYTQECEIMRAIKKAPDSLDRDTIWLWDKVRPETVCLWTGKTDKNGVKIFRGDRVLGDPDGGESVVEWNPHVCAFGLVKDTVYIYPTDKPFFRWSDLEVVSHDKEGER